jgi:hypothetical protein
MCAEAVDRFAVLVLDPCTKSGVAHQRSRSGNLGANHDDHVRAGTRIVAAAERDTGVANGHLGGPGEAVRTTDQLRTRPTKLSACPPSTTDTSERSSRSATDKAPIWGPRGPEFKSRRPDQNHSIWRRTRDSGVPVLHRRSSSYLSISATGTASAARVMCSGYGVRQLTAGVGLSTQNISEVISACRPIG